MVNKEKDPGLEPALRDVDSIQSLDTARLALRWALERMRALEKRVQEMEAGAKASDDARSRAVSELEGTRELLSRRTNEAAERERYYAKVEEYLNLKMEGGLNPVTMAERETRIDAREAELASREIEIESRVQSAKARSDEEIRRVTAEAAASADLRITEARGEAEKRASARERDLSERLIALHEKDAQLGVLERLLEERRKRFEEFHAAQRAALQRESVGINQAAADQADFLERRVEQTLAAKTTALERVWQADKQILLEELASWRAKAREHLPDLLATQRRVAELESAQTRLSAENGLLLQTKEILTDELQHWRQEAQNDLPVRLATVRRTLEAEENVAHLEAELALTQRRAEETLGELICEEMSLQKRRLELTTLETTLAAKLREAEQDLFRQYDNWMEREDSLRRRDQDWRLEAEARRESVNALRAEVTAQRDELKRLIAVYRAKIGAAAHSGNGDAQ